MSEIGCPKRSTYRCITGLTQYRRSDPLASAPQHHVAENKAAANCCGLVGARDQRRCVVGTGWQQVVYVRQALFVLLFNCSGATKAIDHRTSSRFLRFNDCQGHLCDNEADSEYPRYLGKSRSCAAPGHRATAATAAAHAKAAALRALQQHHADQR